MEGRKYLKAFANSNHNQEAALTFLSGILMQLLANLEEFVCIHEVWVYKEDARAPL